jgi:hypothetical protein
LQQNKFFHVNSFFFFLVFLAISSLIFVGCSDNTTSFEETDIFHESSIIAPPSEYLIETPSGFAMLGGGGSTSLGKLHNDVLDEFFTYHSHNGEKISDPEVFFTYMDNAVHEALDTSIFDISKETFQTDYLPVLYELREFGAIDVFSAESWNSYLYGQFFYQKGWLSAIERDWLVGFIDAVEDTQDPIAAQLAINSYCFQNGMPTTTSNLYPFYDIMVHSLTFWGDSSKWGPNWRAIGSGFADAASGAAGVFIGGAAGGPVGGVVGGAVLGSAGSGAVEMMYEAWDEYNE